VYDSTGTGNIAPLWTIIGPNMNYLGGIVADPVNNEIIVANAHANSIVVYGRTANGGFTLARTISGGNTGLNNPWGIAVDTMHNQIYAANDIYNANSVGGSITVYDRADSGDVAPARIISYTGTDVRSPTGIAVDPVHNEIFVLNFGNNSISVYSRATSGDLSLVRTISGADTGIHRPAAIAVDAVHNEIFMANQPPPITAEGFRNSTYIAEDSAYARSSTILDYAPSITVYRRTDDGDVAPERIISGQSTNLHEPTGIAVDPVRNELMAVDVSGSIMVYDRTADGDSAPKQSYSVSTSLAGFSGIAVDTSNNNIFVTDDMGLYNGSIKIYNRNEAGNIVYQGMIYGPDSGLSGPSGIAIDTVNNLIFVANSYSNTITVYGMSNVGDTAPLRTISGVDTGLSGPTGLALW
jgi:DNA-binding beta-propeller fold protein YncE